MSIQFPIHVRPNMIISQIYRITSLVISTVYAMLHFKEIVHALRIICKIQKELIKTFRSAYSFKVPCHIPLWQRYTPVIQLYNDIPLQIRSLVNNDIDHCSEL